MTDPTRLLTSMEGVFGGTYRHPCLAGAAGLNQCGNVLVVPNPEIEGAPKVLEEGQIWTCNGCGANHEYYVLYRDGGRYGCVRLLQGNGDRESGEPRLTEFMEPSK